MPIPTLRLEPMRVRVRTQDGIIPTETSPAETIEDLKKKVQLKSGVPVDQQILQLNGRDLDNPDTLDEAGVRNGDVIDLGEPDPSMTGTLSFPLGSWSFATTHPGGLYPWLLSLRCLYVVFCYPSVYVNTPDGKKLPIEVNPDDQVRDVKKKIADQAGIPVKSQRLFFKEKELANTPTMADLGVQDGDEFDMGGMQVRINKKH